MFNKIYVEIGNICNLSCSFCPELKRDRRQMTAEEFAHVCRSVVGYTDYIYLHVMGEPLLHPKLSQMLDIAHSHGLRVCITTNGTLLEKNKEMLLSHADVIHKVNISVHSIEGNGIEERLEKYMSEILDFARSASTCGIFTILRLWNLDSREALGANLQNNFIEDILHREFPTDWKKRWNGYMLADRIFLEFAGAFVWPAESEAEECTLGSCRGLIDQIAILADGAVVPCCLDSEGRMPLGNIFEDTMESILATPRAVAIKDGFLHGEMREEMCKKCSYAHRFSNKARRMAGEI